MAQSATLKALQQAVEEIRQRGHYGNCQKNSQEYAKWCEWIEGIKARLLILSSALGPSIKGAIQDIEYDWDDWTSVSAAIEQINAVTYLIEDEIEAAGQKARGDGLSKRFETIVHSYTQKRSLGNGGAGNVYLVERDDGDTFALKILNTSSTADSKKNKRFLREVVFCEQNKHMPLVEVIDQGYKQEDELKRPFYVMPLYDESLRGLMNDSACGREFILDMLFTLLASLKGFYNGGHIHRDIKPENILFDKNTNRLVLADFGVAHISDYLPELMLQTTPAERLANFKYAAPEQRISGGEVDHRTDQYAFGLIINELFTGAVPQGSSYAEIASASDAFSYLDPVVERMISQNRDDRYEDVSILLADIEARKKIKGIEDKTFEFESRVIEPSEVSLVGKEWIDPDLVFKLNFVPSREWEQCFRSYSGPTSFCTDGFFLDPKCFTISGNEIRVPSTRGDKGHLADACKAMPDYIHWANEVMKQRVEKENREAHEALVRARENEIKKQESNADINSFLSTI